MMNCSCLCALLFVGLVGLTALRELYVSHNGLTTLDGVESLTNLTILDASGNTITTIQVVSYLFEQFARLIVT